MELKEKQKCEHDLSIIEEHWMSEETCLIVTFCDKCRNKFSGLVTKN